MPFILPEVARRQFIQEKGYSLDEFCEPDKQAEFDAWYDLKLAEPKPAPQPSVQEVIQESAPEMPEEDLPVNAPAEDVIALDPLPEA